MSLIGSVEAALFALGAPTNAEEIGRLVGSPPEDVTGALEVLRLQYKERDGGLVISKTRSGIYTLEVRPHYMGLVTRLVPTELDPGTVKTLALVAVMQPIAQSEIVRRRGERAYNHIRDLVKRGLLKRERAGRSYDLSTTALFGKTFRFKDDPDTIRDALMAELGASPRKIEDESGEEAALALAGDGVALPADMLADLPAEAAPEAPAAAEVDEEMAAGPADDESHETVTDVTALPPLAPIRLTPHPESMKLEEAEGAVTETVNEPIPITRKKKLAAG